MATDCKTKFVAALALDCNEISGLCVLAIYYKNIFAVCLSVGATYLVATS